MNRDWSDGPPVRDPLTSERVVEEFRVHGPGSEVASSNASAYISGVTTTSARNHLDQSILIPTERLKAADLERFRNAPFEKMIKFVVDIRLRKIALGGEMHADAEEELLQAGSEQSDLWGGNLWPWADPPRIEHISLINIRPAADNRGMEILRDDVRAAVRNVVDQWVELG